MKSNKTHIRQQRFGEYIWEILRDIQITKKAPWEWPLHCSHEGSRDGELEESVYEKDKSICKLLGFNLHKNEME